MSPSQLLIFDIETIPDTDAAQRLTGCTPEDGRQALRDYHLKITDGKNDFPRQPFHRVVAISFLRASISSEGRQERYSLEEIRSGGEVISTEAELIRGFFHYAGKHRPRLVGFNSRGFDLPVLKYRAMVHGVSAAWLFDAQDKWNNYSSRYSPDWHCDLLEVLSDFGASAKIKLNEVCAAIGLPGKTGTDGGDVMTLFDQGDIGAIRDYCETDVANTYLVYLRWQALRGALSADGLMRATDELRLLLEEQAVEKEAYRTFLAAWDEASTHKAAVFSV